MRGDNKVVIWGNIGADPEVKNLKSGLKVVNISVPSVESKKNKETDEWENKTHWHRVTLFGSLAANAEKFLKKGNAVFVEAKLRNSSWKDENEKMQYRIDIIATSLQLLDDVSVKKTEHVKEVVDEVNVKDEGEKIIGINSIKNETEEAKGNDDGFEFDAAIPTK